ncbi:hypothetical protein QTH97_10110 [Variovorax sp. J22R24]|uniref:hypothetical protein n=1 Tax=Variovorax gracilis TaxID=3053502 RepID=UPI002578F46B|nr:hypothetical protein [Variovorax sp. J22R24]MDM0105286.1 hypothetical protein [Variovorax sp. J22R24]
MKIVIRISHWLQISFLLVMLVGLSACAIEPKQAFHRFSFDGKSDKWGKEIDLLEYSYGDQYHMVRDRVPLDKDRLGPQSSVNGLMPVGEFLYVKWRIKSTGEVIEDRVDLRNLLPARMDDHGVLFVIDGSQLYVYLVTPKAKGQYDLPILKTTESRYLVTYEIYPVNTFRQ